MKKQHLLTAIAILGGMISAKAQGVDSLFLDSRGSFMQYAGGKNYSSKLTADYLNVHIYGHITNNVTYRIRQRLNVGIDSKNPFRATDWMCLNWQASERLKLYAGKTAIMIGGYEYDSAPIDVYFYSNFCNNLNQCFAFSAGTEYSFASGQTAAVQVANSPLSSGFDDRYSYNLAWIGSFAPWWHTIWSCNFVEDSMGRTINYIALGNHCVWGGLAVDVDFINRASFRQEHFLFADYSAITKVIWSVGRWNFCGKLGYEKNDATNVDASGIAYDTVMKPGSDYIYAGVGIEYFPLGNEDIRLHIATYSDNVIGYTAITTGVKWKFKIL